MSEPRRHHYVPQFYLRRFTDPKDGFWVWDKSTDRVFRSAPKSLAVETDLYKIHDFIPLGHDPFLMEKQLAGIDREMSLITEQWVDWLRSIKPTERIEVPSINRQIVSRFMSLQFFRTADTKETVCALFEQEHPDKAFSEEDRTRLHTELLWNLSTVDMIAKHIEEAIWVFARNETSTPFVTSDNPVAFRSKDNRMWLKAGFVTEGSYAVYPLSPDIVMFCHERGYWDKVKRFDQCLSPVMLDEEMIESENSGQVFMANRFVISPVNDFERSRQFASSIGTDKYVPANDQNK